MPGAASVTKDTTQVTLSICLISTEIHYIAHRHMRCTYSHMLPDIVVSKGWCILAIPRDGFN